ncbi:MAG: tetratricopeptide repeat protein [Bryobacteraceae bacterium]
MRTCKPVAAFLRRARQQAVFGIMLALALPMCGAEAASEQAVAQGIAAFQQGRYADASRQLQDALRQDPANEHARTFLALTRAATGHCAEAIPDLGARFSQSTDADLSRLAGLALAQCLVTQNEVAQAVPVVVQLEAKYPDDADVLYEAARVHMKAFNDATFRMFQKTPSSWRVNQLSGEIFETRGKYAEAAGEYRKAIEKNPRALNLHFRLGRALLLESHDPDALAQAQKEFEAELALNAEDAAAEFQLGQILNAQRKREEALQKYEKALALSPDFCEAALAAAKMRVQAKEYASAIPLLERVVALQPANEAAHYNLMLAYRNSGQMDKARHEQQELNKLQRPPEGEFTDFLKRLGEGTPVK